MTNILLGSEQIMPPKYQPYEELSQSEYERLEKALIRHWSSFVDENDSSLKDDQIHIHQKNLYEVIRRVERRVAYYEIFHELHKICEYKRTGITCYWLIKLKPFIVIDPDSCLYNSPNELFAFYYIMADFRSAFNELYGDNISFEYPSKDRVKEILYNFKYCNFSCEAIINFVETLAFEFRVPCIRHRDL